MRDSVAPFLLGAALLGAVVDNGGSEGAGNGDEDEPVAGREFEAQSREAYNLIGKWFSGYMTFLYRVPKKTGLPSNAEGLGVGGLGASAIKGVEVALPELLMVASYV